ncbi:hypothetical protein D3C76_471140 [compost metagenome]
MAIFCFKRNDSVLNEARQSAGEVYEICIRARDFEISQLSSRNNFLMVFQGVLFAGLLQSQGQYPILSFLTCVCGVAVSVFQTGMAAGAKYWQEYWQAQVVVAEERLLAAIAASNFSREKHKLFTASAQEARSIVEQRLINGKAGWVTREIILLKFSVSRIPIYLSFSLIVIWLVLLICTLNVSWGMMIPDFIVGFQPKR